MNIQSVITVCFFLVTETHSRPAEETDSFDVDLYLERYGYLQPQVAVKGRKSSVELQRFHSEDDRRHAIRLFQKFANLAQTGEINDETIEMMQQPRCGFKDILSVRTDPSLPLQYNTGPKWPKQLVTWSVSSYTEKLPVVQQRSAIQNSFKRWEDASGLQFAATSNGTADIVIEFTTGNHGDGLVNAFDGPGGVLAHAFYPEDGRAHFDDDEAWVFHKSVGAELETIMTHEIGHSLGLSHSVVRGAIMAPFYQRYVDNFTLHEDDILGIQSLYGTPVVPTTTEKISSSSNTTSSEPHQGSLEPKEVDTRLCNSRFDAIIPGPQDFIHLFIGRFVYRLQNNCVRSEFCVVDGYPKQIREVFRKGPKRVTTAVFVPDERQRTYLLKGRKLWRYKGFKLDKGYPKQMDKKDLPYKPNAAFIHKNQFADYQLYIFGGKYFWELNLDAEAITGDVMKIKTYWDHVPNKPHAMMQTKDGSIYVFKGTRYNKYDHRRVLLERNKDITKGLLGSDCSHNTTKE